MNNELVALLRQYIIKDMNGFANTSNVTTTISGNTITQTDGVKTLTTTISGSTIMEVWT